jgi:diguanylate cyclase (GGDEF)-like protein
LGPGVRPRFFFIAATIVGILAMQLVAVIVAGVAARRDSETAAQDLFRYVGDATVERVFRFTEPAANLTRELVATADNGELPSDLLEVEDWLFEHFRYRSGVAGTYIGYPDGSYVSVGRIDGGYEAKIIVTDPVREVTIERYDARFHLLSSTTDPTDEYDPRIRPWYQLAEASDRLSWTDPFLFFASGEPGVSATLAVREGDTVVAVVGAEVKIKDLSLLLAALPLGSDGEAFILTDTRTIVAAPPRYADLMTGADGGSTLSIPAGALGIPDSRPEGLSSASPEVFGGDSTSVTLERLFPNDSGIQWTLYLRATDEGLSTGLGGFQSTMLWLSLLIAGLVLAATYFLYRLRYPIGVLSAHAGTDELTRLANRRRFHEQGQALVRSALADGERVCVAVFDLDGFKSINDTFGHGVGDEALKTTASALAEASRERDLVARLGGDEFAIVRRLAKSASAGTVVERIRSHVEGALRSRSEEWGPVGVTAGYSVSDAVDRGLGVLVQEADDALIKGKARRKGTTNPGRRVVSRGGVPSTGARR